MPPRPRIISINLGLTQSLQSGGRMVKTAIDKRPVAEPVWLGELGLEGDEQADRRFHGGPDKAVNIYPSEHYSYWSERLALPLSAGAFGENFTTAGLLETEVAIGDTFRVGDAVVQVTQPRTPCSKLAGRHAQPQLIRWVNESRFTGFYVRCLEPGEVQPGDSLEPIARSGTDIISVAEAHRIQILEPDDRIGARRLLSIPELSQAWREAIEERLKRSSD